MDEAGRFLGAGEIGEIVARTDRVTLAEGEWHHTKDLGWMDEEGLVFLAGRTDDVINLKGYKVHPAEVEATISEVPWVLDCAVTGVADERFGLVLAAVVRGGAGPCPAPNDVIQYTRAQLGPVKVPRLVHCTNEVLPRTGQGRLDRKAIARRYESVFQQMLQNARMAIG